VMRFLLLWGPVVLHMALIFTASSSSDPGAPAGVSDKVLHFAVFALLGLLVARAVAGGLFTCLALTQAIAAFVVTVLYGVSDEVHQAFVPNRSPDVLDVAADAAGAAVGVAVVAALGWVRTLMRRDRAEASAGDRTGV
jgi:VanZ family protein